MSNTTTTPYMSLVLPIPGLEIGPQYAIEQNTAFTAIDQHTHVAGQGLPVPTAGLNINNDLPFNAYNAISLRSSRFNSQLSPLALVTDLNCVYVVAGELFYNDGLGNQVQITLGGAVDTSSSGNITGMGSTTASVVYTDIDKFFSFYSDTNLPAFLYTGPISIGAHVVSPFTITLNPPVGLSSNKNIFLPDLPASNLIMRMDATGTQTANLGVDGTTITAAGNLLGVPNGGIDTNQLATKAVTFTKIADGAVGALQLADNAVQTSKIVDLNVTTAKIANKAVDFTKLGDASVGALQLADNAVQTSKIVDLNVTTAKIADANVTEVKIAANSVITSKIADGSVTAAKLNSLGQTHSVSSGNFTTLSTSFVTVISTTITVAARPVMIIVQGDGTNPSDVGISASSTGGTIQIFRNGVLNIEVCSSLVNQPNGPFPSMVGFDTPGTGSVTYELRAKTASGLSLLSVKNLIIYAYEIH